MGYSWLVNARPEQIRAKEYLDQQGSRRSPTQIRERVAAGFAALEELLDGVTEAEARLQPIPGEWSVHEVVDHLVETHRPSLEELRDLLGGRSPLGGPIPAGLQSPEPLARPWPQLLSELKDLQREVVVALAAAPDGLNEARAPVVMVINVKETDGNERPLHWIEDLDWKAYAIVFRLHVLDHLGQARKVLRAARGA